MSFEEFIAAIDADVRKQYPTVGLERTSTLARWSLIEYAAEIVSDDHGGVTIPFEIGDQRDKFDPQRIAAESIPTVASMVNMVLHASKSHYRLGLPSFPDPGVTKCGDGWTYVDSAGRDVVASRYLGAPMGNERAHETLVTDPGIAIVNVPLLAYLSDQRPTAKHKHEAEQIAQLLAATGSRAVALHVGDAPDLEARLYGGYGATVYVEHARVVVRHSAEFVSRVDAAAAAFKGNVANNPLLATALDHVDFQVNIQYNEREAPKSQRLVEELDRFVLGSDYQGAQEGTRMRFDSTYVELHRFGAVYVKRKVRAASVPIVKVAGKFDDARVLSNRVRQIIDLKVGKAERYGKSPLWLALYMHDRNETNEFSINALQYKALEFGPYEKLIAGTEREGLCFQLVQRQT